MARAYYRIEVVSEVLEIPRAQLRRYERLGLIAPSGEPEPASAAPRYTDEDLQRLRRIRRMQRDLGLDLAALQVVLPLRDRIDLLLAQVAELQRQLAERG